MPDEQDVTVTPSSDSPPSGSAPAAVSSEGTPPAGDRPVQNVVAEMNRKFQEQQQQLSTLTQAITALIAQPQSRTPLPSAPAQTRDYTDDELRQLADSGSSQATVMLAQRAARLENQTFQAEQQKQALVTGKLQLMYRNYPQLRDPSHPLGQQALANKQALLMQGRANNFELDLEVCQDAVLTNPQYAVSAGAASEAARQSALSSHVVEPGAPRRQQSRPNKAERPMSPDAIKMSRRMGVSDPQGAIKRFLKRIEDGETVITPGIRSVLGGEIE